MSEPTTTPSGPFGQLWQRIKAKLLGQSALDAARLEQLTQELAELQIKHNEQNQLLQASMNTLQGYVARVRLVDGQVLEVLAVAKDLPVDLQPVVGQLIGANLPTHLRVILHSVLNQTNAIQLDWQDRRCSVIGQPIDAEKALLVMQSVPLGLDETPAAAQQRLAITRELWAGLRHPLGTVQTMMQALAMTPLDTEQTELLIRLQTSLLALDQIAAEVREGGKPVPPKVEPIDLLNCIEDVFDILAGELIRNPVELIYIPDDDTPAMIMGDQNRLRQILGGLVGNAVERSKQGEVVVSTQLLRNDDDDPQAASVVQFSVRDKADPLTDSELEKLFDIQTADGALAGVQQLAASVGGQVWAEAALDHRGGNLLHFMLPSPAVAQPAKQRLVQSQPALKGKRLLIAEGSARLRYLLVRHARRWGMQPRAVDNGLELLTQLQQNDAADILLIDLNLPETDVLKLLEKLRHVPGASGVPVVLLTRLGQLAIMNTGLANARVTKPIRAQALLDTLLELEAISSPQLEFSDTHLTDTATPKYSGLDRSMATSHPLRILLAEDNQVNQQVARRMLERLGYDSVVIVGNGQAAIDALKEQSFDVVLMDMQMPVMDGLSATQYILSHWPADERPRLVAMTAFALQGDREKYISAGLDDYLSKPARIEELAAVLARVRLRTVPSVLDLLNEAGTHAPLKTDRVPLIDESVLESIAHAIGEKGPAVVAELIEVFLSDSPALLAEARAGLDTQDLDPTERSAHTLKSSSASIGAMRVSHLARQLEASAAANQLARTKELFAELEKVYASTQVALSKKLT